MNRTEVSLLNRIIPTLLLAATVTGCAIFPGYSLRENPTPAPPPRSPTAAAPPRAFTAPPLTQTWVALNSYRADFVAEFEGTVNGQQTAGQIESRVEAQREPPLRHRRQVVSGTGPHPAGVTEMMSGEVGVFFSRPGGKVWLASGAVADAPLPASAFLPLENLVVLPQTVTGPPAANVLDGQPVQVFHFSAANLSDSALAFEQASGEVWLAPGENTVLRYVISGTVRSSESPPNPHLLDQGRLRLEYTLSRADAPLEITLPPPAAPLTDTLAALPRLPDADLSRAYPTLLEYSSAVTPPLAAQFYQAQLPPLGWTPVITSVFNEKARLAFTQENSQLTVVINPAAEIGQTTVLVDLEAQP